MNLLSVIIALIIESVVTTLSSWRQFDLFNQYVDGFRQKLPSFSYQPGVVALVIILGTVLFAVWLIDAMLGGVLGLFSFLFGIAVLIFCIGPRDLEEDVQNITSSFEKQDYEAANIHTANLVGRTVTEPPMQLAQTVKEGVLLQANNRLLAVIFWFVLLGPVGAVMFRLSSLLKESLVSETDEFAEASRDLYDILIWLPARFTVLSYAIAGNFVDTMSYWYGLSDLWSRESEDFIIVSGIGALRYERRVDHSENEEDPDVNGIHHALSLVKRAVIVWVVVLALLTLTGWLF